MHPETIGQIRAGLTAAGIGYCALRGARAQRDTAVRELRDNPHVRVMLVVSPRDCAGLDLPFLTHVVLYHRLLDRNVEAQVVARGQRLGRQHNLEVVSLLNEGEVEVPGAGQGAVFAVGMRQGLGAAPEARVAVEEAAIHEQFAAANAVAVAANAPPVDAAAAAAAADEQALLELLAALG